MIDLKFVPTNSRPSDKFAFLSRPWRRLNLGPVVLTTPRAFTSGPPDPRPSIDKNTNLTAKQHLHSPVRSTCLLQAGAPFHFAISLGGIIQPCIPSTNRIATLTKVLTSPWWVMGLLSGILLPLSGPTAGTPPPTIRLFPTTVVENVKESSQVAKDMEMSLQGVIAQLEQQWDLYQESKCEGNESDGGCAQIAQQMGDKYLEMLSLMDEQLPQIEHSVQATVDSLENRLRQELGQKLTARDLQEVLVAETPSPRQSSSPTKLRGRSSHRLSERFRQYYNLVLQASAQSGGDSVALAAADIYLDSKEVLKLLRLTQNEINRAQLMIELRNQFGAVTPEMHEVVTGVKKILLGGTGVGAAPYEASPPSTAFPEEEYHSPLEF